MIKAPRMATWAATSGLLAVVLQGCVPGPAIMPGGGHFGATSYGESQRPTPHKGVDYQKQRGTPVIAAGQGQVTRLSIESPTTRTRSQCGNGVNIFHTGPAAKHMTKYCHMQKVIVKAGDTVEQGQVLGTIGTSGCRKGLNCAPHLHFEVWHDYRVVDPATRISGCYEEGTTQVNPDKPLIYPVKC